MIEQVFDDLRLAWRGLRRARGFTLAATITLAVGIAATTTMFALIEGVLLRPLPVPEQHRLFVAWGQVRSAEPGHWPFRPGDIEKLEADSRTVDSLAGVSYNGVGSFVAVDRGVASYLRGTSVTGDFFRVLRVQPLFGRTLLRGDDVSGAEKVLVITHGAWQRRYGGAPDVVGRSIIVNERPFTIVGVMPPDFEYPRGVEAWMTVTANTSLLTHPEFRVDVDLIGRLRRGVTLEQARGELQTLTAVLEERGPASAPRGMTVVAHSYDEVVTGDVRAALLMLFAAVTFVLLVASANVANLLLLRAEARRRELAIRAALGGGRRRLMRQLISESVLLAGIAAVAGLVVAWFALDALVALVPEGVPRVESIRIDWAVVLFTIAVTLATAAAAGVAPAILSAGRDLTSHLRGARVTTASGSRRGRRMLVATQVALAVVVVAGAGLLTRSLLRLQALETGMAAERLVFVQLALPEAKYNDRTRHLQFLDRAVAELEAVPDISGATPVNAAPFSGTGGWDALFTAEGQSADRAAANPLLNLEAIHPNYFATVGVPIVRGRAFTRADRQGAPEVAIVSEDVAARAWPGEDPVGKRVKFGGGDSPFAWRLVVGVARPTRYRELREPRPTLYLPAEQFIISAQMLVVRSAAPLTRVSSMVRDRLRRVDPDVRVMRVAPFAELLDGPLARPRFNAFLIVVFAVVSLLLAAVGLYAVMAAYVRQRDVDLGIRVALGATARDVRRLVLSEGLGLSAVGAAVGVVVAIAATRLLRGLLFEVQPMDIPSLMGAAILLLAVSALACYLPARRAARVDPIVTLRSN